MDKSFKEFVEICGLLLPITEEDLSENATKTQLQLGLLRDHMVKLKQSLSSNIDYEKSSIYNSVKSLWQVIII